MVVLQSAVEGIVGMLMLIVLVPMLLMIAGMWKIFTKAGEPG